MALTAQHGGSGMRCTSMPPVPPVPRPFLSASGCAYRSCTAHASGRSSPTLAAVLTS